MANALEAVHLVEPEPKTEKSEVPKGAVVVHRAHDVGHGHKKNHENSDGKRKKNSDFFIINELAGSLLNGMEFMGTAEVTCDIRKIGTDGKAEPDGQVQRHITVLKNKGCPVAMVFVTEHPEVKCGYCYLGFSKEDFRQNAYADLDWGSIPRPSTPKYPRVIYTPKVFKGATDRMIFIKWSEAGDNREYGFRYKSIAEIASRIVLSHLKKEYTDLVSHEINSLSINPLQTMLFNKLSVDKIVAGIRWVKSADEPHIRLYRSEHIIAEAANLTNDAAFGHGEIKKAKKNQGQWRPKVIAENGDQKKYERAPCPHGDMTLLLRRVINDIVTVDATESIIAQSTIV